MNPVPQPTGPRYRWLGWVAFILAVQLGFIFWLGNWQPGDIHQARPAPDIFLTDTTPSGLAEVDDPALFALPSRNGFAGLAWALTPRLQYTNADWTTPLTGWAFPAAALDTGLQPLLAATVVPPLQIAEKPAPQPGDFPGLPALDLLPEKSTLQITGGVADRPLVTPLNLPDQPAADVLAPTEVRVLVSPDGAVFSAVLLASSHSAPADQQALTLARAARFAPLPDATSLVRNPARLGWGRMWFAWRTVPPPAAPGGNP